MAILFKGIVQVTGEQDTGKTTFALGGSTSIPDICFIDDDIKGRSAVDDLEKEGHKIGLYIDLINEGKGMLETQFFAHCMDIIKTRIPEHIKKNRGEKKFELLVWDTWAKFENTIFPTVHKNPGKYREVYSAKGDIKGAQEWQASFELEADILSRFNDIADMVILVSHLKSDSLNGVKTGKLVPDSKRPLAQKCFMRVYLKHNPVGAYPIGLILKRPSRRTATENGIETINILPRKMQPFTWARIREFWKNPVGDVGFLPGELPDENDISCLEGILTKQQMEVFLNSVELVKMGITEDTPLPETAERVFSEQDIERVKILKADQKTLPEISRETGYSIPDIAKMLAQ